MASKEAHQINEAHQLYKQALGTPNEHAALAYLEAVVRNTRRKS